MTARATISTGNFLTLYGVSSYKKVDYFWALCHNEKFTICHNIFMKLSPLAVPAVFILEVFVAISLYKVTSTCPLSLPWFNITEIMSTVSELTFTWPRVRCTWSSCTEPFHCAIKNISKLLEMLHIHGRGHVLWLI